MTPAIQSLKSGKVAMNAKSRNILNWSIIGMVVLCFLGAGLSKLLTAEKVLEQFQEWGISDQMRMLIGSVEIIGAIGLLIPLLRKWAILVLTGLMIGALYTHFVNYEFKLTEYGGALIMIVFLMILLWLDKLYNKT